MGIGIGPYLNLHQLTTLILYDLSDTSRMHWSEMLDTLCCMPALEDLQLFEVLRGYDSDDDDDPQPDVRVTLHQLQYVDIHEDWENARAVYNRFLCPCAKHISLHYIGDMEDVSELCEWAAVRSFIQQVQSSNDRFNTCEIFDSDWTLVIRLC
jgi:hypothetical protein